MAESVSNQNSANQLHIFLDIDGVLGDFDLHARQQGKLTADGKVKYSALDHAWWATMPATEGARDFYDAMLKIGAVRFLTGPILNEECFSGKAHWVQEFVPERGKGAMKDLIICASGDKAYLAGPRRILVDDRIANVNAWIAAGGIGIHHTGDFRETLKKLQAAIAPKSAPAKKRGLGGIFPKFQ